MEWADDDTARPSTDGRAVQVDSPDATRVAFEAFLNWAEAGRSPVRVVYTPEPLPSSRPSQPEPDPLTFLQTAWETGRPLDEVRRQTWDQRVPRSPGLAGRRVRCDRSVEFRL